MGSYIWVEVSKGSPDRLPMAEKQWNLVRQPGHTSVSPRARVFCTAADPACWEYEIPYEMSRGVSDDLKRAMILAEISARVADVERQYPLRIPGRVK